MASPDRCEATDYLLRALTTNEVRRPLNLGLPDGIKLEAVLWREGVFQCVPSAQLLLSMF